MNGHTWSVAEKATLESFLHEEISRAPIGGKLHSAISYSIFSGGKRIRPLLALAICEDLGGDSKTVLGSAAALELLHCSSLVHDDLPAVDNDDMRRGKPSCHREFGEATALFAGTTQISLAVEFACRCDVAPELKLQMVEELSTAYTQLCDGQQLDLLVGDERGDIRTLYEKKTGALFAAACAIGALAAGSTQQLVSSAKGYGVELGVYFQMLDDVIDRRPEKGRAESSDARNEKLTAIALQGDDALRESADRVESALEVIESLSNSSLARVRILTRELFDR